MVVETRHSVPTKAPTTALKIKLPHPNASRYNTRRSSQSQHSAIEKSGSEYNDNDEDGSAADAEGEGDAEDMEDADAEGEAEPEEPEAMVYATKSGRLTSLKGTYVESSDNDEEMGPIKSSTSKSRGRAKAVHDSEDEVPQPERPYALRDRSARKSGSTAPSNGSSNRSSGPSKADKQKTDRSTRLKKRNAREVKEEASFEVAEVDEEEEAEDSEGLHTASDDRPSITRPKKQSRAVIPPEPHDGYGLRKRAPVNYAIPPPLEAAELAAMAKSGRNGGGRAKPRKPLGWNMKGSELSKYVPLPGDDSDSDAVGRSPRKRPGANIFGAAAAASGTAAGGLFAPGTGDPSAAAGGPSNYGRVTGASTHQLSDSDPLGINPNINFSSVGGLDTHIASLKEMTLLPLLYPEVFQRFGVTPPRGVLFHGPPGTGKTLLARALASSCRAEGGRQIAFFMRKGADVLSKWVGEAERQLRLLFDEARAAQPSIIFFDEIDGLAPVRSSKQDQIHASIVSTLLALMDGMDGRGQVIVIGATNRPDAVDPALRRPGRFDREFYFPLPNLEARERILTIHTSSWEGWEEEGSAMRKQLAKMTKGYGGADLRALCTEASLNAVKRCYPQIYRSEDRLVIEPQKIKVEARDFMSCINKLVPSSARSSASTANPLPSQLAPLLTPALEHVKSVLAKLIPPNAKTRDLLEEAEYEYPDDNKGGLEREMLLQSMESLRVYRPRVVLCGGEPGGGKGVGYVGAAVLDWLEGFHVQSLDLGSLMSDSTRTPEAAIVQLFVEAKRNQPSVIYIPSLTGWCGGVSETARSTVKAMLDSLAPTDPILLLAVVEDTFTSLPRDVRAWFGLARSSANRVDFMPSFAPTAEQRSEFFKDLLDNVKRPPNEFPDGWKRRKRILEKLPIAPPVAPKPPSEAELATQLDNDMRTMSVLKYRLGPVLNDLKRKFKMFTKRAHEDYGFDPEICEFVPPPIQDALQPHANGDLDVNPIVADDAPLEFESPIQQHQEQQQMQLDEPPPLPRIKMHNMDLERMHENLYCDKYLTLDDFLRDIEKIVSNVYLAGQVGIQIENERIFKAQALKTAAEVHYHDFDPTFRTECERMAVRERQRREEDRVLREQEKEKENPTPPPGIRRSNRSNGLAPELGITDVGKLERSLKRQRSSEAATPNDTREMDDEPERENKRTRMSDDEAVVGQSAGPSESHLGNVNDMEQSHDTVLAPDVTPHPNEQAPPQPTTPFPTGPFHSGPYPHTSAGSGNMMLSSILNGSDSTPQPYDTGVSGASVSANSQPYLSFGVEPGALQPHSGFNSSMAPYYPQDHNQTFPFGPSNPHIPPFVNPAPGLQSYPGDVVMGMPGGEMPWQNSSDQQSYVGVPPPLPQMQLQQDSHQQMPPPPVLPLNTIPEPIAPIPQAPTSSELAPPPVPSVVPSRPPTPPPPFNVPHEVEDLGTELISNTALLNVEELEQLRATALDAVWRSRTNWDRTDLVKELRQLVKEFISDAQAGDRNLEED